MAPSNLFSELPLELLCEIIKFLPLKDLKTLSLASRLTRSLAIPSIFGHLRYTGDFPYKICQIHQARKDVKEAIKKLELLSDFEKNETLQVVMFQFLETLPNLQVLDVRDLAPAYLSQFISSIRHTALLELVLYTTRGPLEEPPTEGITGLKKLSISWHTYENPNELGSSLAHLYELIRPTLTTLVEFRIDNLSYNDFDLQLLEPSADTLRTFEYTLHASADEGLLDIIPMILPHLTKLSIKWEDSYTDDRSILWKDAHIQALSKNNYLTDLELSSDFEVKTQDAIEAGSNDYAWFVRSYERRLEATQNIASACPRLQRCSWVQMSPGLGGFFEMSHSFIVEERMSGGNLTRVVRGIKQDWMGRDHKSYLGGDIVKCKLEDLPGDIIGQNDVE